MFNFFKQSAPIEAPDSSPAPYPVPPPKPAPNMHKPQSDIQRELLRGVFKDTMRRHGIPAELLACEVSTAANDPQDGAIHVHLVVLKWHELLLRYARALELQLLRGLDRLEPDVNHIKNYTFSWRLAPECGSPFTVMPPAVVWAHNDAAPSVAEEPPAILDRRQKKRPPKAGPDNYERTELSPFR